jgi:hypothetical protein
MIMAATDYSYIGPPIDDSAILVELPVPLVRLLAETNGFVAYDGGLHVRGACHAPSWHSLRYWWRGDDALHRQFSAVRASDVPFAEDALGDQYLIRDDEVHRLFAEQGEVQALSFGVKGFLAAAERDPVGFLGLEPLQKFREEGSVLAPGELLSVYPPFFAAESSQKVNMRAIPTAERIGFLAHLARTIEGLPEGLPIRFRTTE